MAYCLFVLRYKKILIKLEVLGFHSIYQHKSQSEIRVTFEGVNH